MNGGSLGSSKRTLDIKNESDALTLLQILRGSPLDPVSKDEIRDLVFALRSNFTSELLETLAVHVAPLGVSLVGVGDTIQSPVPTATATEVHFTTASEQPTTIVNTVRGLGSRPAPQFGSGVVTNTVASRTQTPPISPPVETNTPVPPVDATTAPPVNASESTADAAPIAPQPTAQTPVTNSTTTAVAPNESSVVSASAEQPVASAAVVSATAAVDAKQRIEEIKRDINARVGNPVNLIDVTNEVGREYMNALLGAMKAVAGAGDSVTAMARLESAYQAVLSALVADNDVSTATNTSATTSEAQPVTPETDSNKTATRDTVSPAVVTHTEAEASKKVTASIDSKVSPAVAPVKGTDTADMASTTQSPVTGLTSVAAANAASISTKIPEADPTPAPSDDLMGDLVTEGLKQLLSEWSLFKGGGLFGAGPKGIDHPLYQELRHTPMSLVIAGRFEGATPEVKQSIHDYMNGWRYEQGVTHDLKETFEHYLRRVVKTIIDKQIKSQ